MSKDGLTPELLSALSLLIAGVLGAVGTLFTRLWRLDPRQARQLRQRVRDLERQVQARDLHIFALEQQVVAAGHQPLPRPWNDKPRRRRAVQ